MEATVVVEGVATGVEAGAGDAVMEAMVVVEGVATGVEAGAGEAAVVGLPSHPMVRRLQQPTARRVHPQSEVVAEVGIVEVEVEQPQQPRLSLLSSSAAAMVRRLLWARVVQPTRARSSHVVGEVEVVAQAVEPRLLPQRRRLTQRRRTRVRRLTAHRVAEAVEEVVVVVDVAAVAAVPLSRWTPLHTMLPLHLALPQQPRRCHRHPRTMAVVVAVAVVEVEAANSVDEVVHVPPRPCMCSVHPSAMVSSPCICCVRATVSSGVAVCRTVLPVVLDSLGGVDAAVLVQRQALETKIAAVAQVQVQVQALVQHPCSTRCPPSSCCRQPHRPSAFAWRLRSRGRSRSPRWTALTTARRPTPTTRRSSSARSSG
jgi:hypothetical protein